MAKKPYNRKKKKNQNKLILTVSGLAAVAVIGTVLYLTVFSSAPVGDIIAQAATKGDPNAPVLIVEYADFQCSACRFMALNITPDLIAEFVDTGLVRFEFRHFAHYGTESTWAGMASECANEQGEFWAYHDYLYNIQREPNTGVFTSNRLKDYASRVGLNQTEFNECLNSGKYHRKVRDQTQEAISRGGTGTPTIFINNIKLGAVPSISQLRGLIERELNGQ